MTKQREIKFRIWDKELGMMCWEDINNTPIKKIFQDNILMQYTGLKDKQGKEIYEGDMVANKLNPKGFEVKWSKYGGFDFFCDGKNSQDGRNWKIIGNIYENPKLLKK